jgi:hypothetical protein
MLITYCDDGGGEDHGFTVICGWASTADQWDGFEVDWKLLLVRYEVSFFHMMALAHFKGPYAKWKDTPSTRDRFLADAGSIIKSRVKHGFLAYVKHSDFKTVNSLFELEESFGSAHGLAGRLCMDRADNWRRKENYGFDETLYVFEDGPLYADISKATSAINPRLPIPHFEASRDLKPCHEWPEGRIGIVQLQSADYLAYEYRKAIADRMSKGLKAHRKSLQALLGTPLEGAGFATSMNLARFCMAHNIKKRLPNSEIYEGFKT